MSSVRKKRAEVQARLDKTFWPMLLLTETTTSHKTLSFLHESCITHNSGMVVIYNYSKMKSLEVGPMEWSAKPYGDNVSVPPNVFSSHPMTLKL